MSSRREENMFRRLSVMLLVSVVFAFPAVAQALDPVHPDTFLYTAQTVLLILGMAFAGYWAYEAFDAPPIKLRDGPTLPRYMTQPTQYRLGVLAYVGVRLLGYALIAYFHKPLLPILRVLAPELYDTIDQSMSDGSLPYPLVVTFGVTVFAPLM